MPNDTLNRWVRGERDPGLSKIGPVIDKILWNYAKPEKIGVLEVRFPEAVEDASGSTKECQRLREELETAKKKIAELEKKLIAAEAIGGKLEEMMNRRLTITTPDEFRKKKALRSKKGKPKKRMCSHSC